MTRARIQGRLDLDQATYDALVAHARSDFPYEVCGLLAGDAGRVVKHYEIPNAARSMTFYTMEPKALLHAMNEMDDQGWDLLAIYHSHTHTEAFPSATDVELAFYPDAVYLVVSLQDNDAPAIRGFDIVGGEIAERVVYVDGAEAPVGTR
ncbi:MAG: M67 family metallopeptidase [Actinomycetota bacterium]|nr:M67 family metallopeptidase [Actinomycetota bacterium]